MLKHVFYICLICLQYFSIFQCFAEGTVFFPPEKQGVQFYGDYIIWYEVENGRTCYYYRKSSENADISHTLTQTVRKVWGEAIQSFQISGDYAVWMFQDGTLKDAQYFAKRISDIDSPIFPVTQKARGFWDDEISDFEMYGNVAVWMYRDNAANEAAFYSRCLVHDEDPVQISQTADEFWDDEFSDFMVQGRQAMWMFRKGRDGEAGLFSSELEECSRMETGSAFPSGSAVIGRDIISGQAFDPDTVLPIRVQLWIDDQPIRTVLTDPFTRSFEFDIREWTRSFRTPRIRIVAVDSIDEAVVGEKGVYAKEAPDPQHVVIFEGRL